MAPAGTVLGDALELAEAIAGNAPISIRESKALPYRCAWKQGRWWLNQAAMFGHLRAQRGSSTVLVSCLNDPSGPVNASACC